MVDHKDGPVVVLEVFLKVIQLAETVRIDHYNKIEFAQLASAPPMTSAGSEDAVAFVRQLTGENAPPSQVAYGAEGGQFQQAGFPTLICGPGSIEQAHQPDEWIAIAQFEEGARFMERLARALA